MKFLIILLFFIFLNNCSLNKDSKFWNKDIRKKIDNIEITSEIIKKSEDIKNMNRDEYKIYIDDHIKKSKYPNITQ